MWRNKTKRVMESDIYILCHHQLASLLPFRLIDKPSPLVIGTSKELVHGDKMPLVWIDMEVTGGEAFIHPTEIRLISLLRSLLCS